MKRTSQRAAVVAIFTVSMAMTGQASAQEALETEAVAEEAPAPEALAPEEPELEALAEEQSEPKTVAPVKYEPQPLNSIYVEGLGAGVLYSFNYERVLPMDFAVRLGFGYLGLAATAADSEAGVEGSVSVGFYSIPITVSWLGLRTDSNHHMLELGVGATVIGTSAAAAVEVPLAGALFSGDATVTALPHFVIGYRLQVGFLQFRAGFTPLVNAVGLIPLPHMSLGGAF